MGEVKSGLFRIEQRNKFSVGEMIEIMKPDGRNVEVEVKRILNEEGEEQESAPHSKQVLYVELSEPAHVYDILRRAEVQRGSDGEWNSGGKILLCPCIHDTITFIWIKGEWEEIENITGTDYNGDEGRVCESGL